MAKKETKKNQKEFKIPSDAKELAKLSFKKFKKSNGDFYDSKKELKKGYYSNIVDLLPESLKLIVRYGHIEEVKETKNLIFEKITDPAFVKFMTKFIEDDNEFDNMDLLPNVISTIVREYNAYVAEAKKENPDAEVTVIDLSDLIELSKLILKKKIKKMKKDGIDESVAFDVLSEIPTVRILEKSPYYHIRNLFGILYEHAKDKDINFDKIIKHLVKKDEVAYQGIISFALLERKEKIQNFNDSQKKLFNDITQWCFKTLNDMSKDEIKAVITTYVNARKKDDANGKDSNRRYYISSLPESDYGKIINVVNKFIKEDESLKKYF